MYVTIGYSWQRYNKYGVNNSEQKWFDCYLSGREQITETKINLPERSPMDISVIQGRIIRSSRE
jgi:hypothetical protein